MRLLDWCGPDVKGHFCDENIFLCVLFFFLPLFLVYCIGISKCALDGLYRYTVSCKAYNLGTILDIFRQLTNDVYFPPNIACISNFPKCLPSSGSLENMAARHCRSGKWTDDHGIITQVRYHRLLPKKLDGVDPLISDPPPTSFTTRRK